MIQAEQVKSSVLHVFAAVWRSIPYSIPPFHSSTWRHVPRFTPTHYLYYTGDVYLFFFQTWINSAITSECSIIIFSSFIIMSITAYWWHAALPFCIRERSGRIKEKDLLWPFHGQSTIIAFFIACDTVFLINKIQEILLPIWYYFLG